MSKTIKESASHMTTSMSKPTTMSIREPASQMSKPIAISIMKKQSTIKTKQQLLAKEVFTPRITKFRTEKLIPRYKKETWSADLIDKSSLNKFNNNYKFILTVTDIFTKYAGLLH